VVVDILGILKAVDLTVTLRARPTVRIAGIDERIVSIAIHIISPNVCEALLLVEADCRLVLRPHYFGSGDQARPILRLREGRPDARKFIVRHPTRQLFDRISSLKTDLD
jgi:hypothetical protein